MKNRIKLIAMALLAGFVATSCSDMLNTESERQLFEVDLNQKTDSLFFSFGVMNAMQQLADQYVVQNEMRGDLVATTKYTDKNLAQLANFTATTANRYDSAYVYYRVINNCNYYIAHRDTTLRTGSENVVLNEYAAMKAFRAWAYLQLVRTYGKVPFFLEPLTKISQIDNNNYPMVGISELVDALAPDLKPYTGFPVPDYGTINCGNANLGGAKNIRSTLCFIPVDVILAELYLENGDYANACLHYYTYLYNKRGIVRNFYSSVNYSKFSADEEFALPSDFSSYTGSGQWFANTFTNTNNDIVSLIPMAVNKLNGTTTQIPLLFGYNYYATAESSDERRTEEIQIAPSATFDMLADSADYYYQSNLDILGRDVRSIKLGDMRKAAIYRLSGNTGNTTVTTPGDPSTEQTEAKWMEKYNNGNIILYRYTTLYLHLAEALNRMGYPDAAFAVLKDGLNYKLANDTTYMQPSTIELLSTTYPFLAPENQLVFEENFGTRVHGCGYVPGTFSPYQMDTIVGMKMQEIAKQFNVTVGTTKADSINAMEDLLCDEYAMEMAFEGHRMSDLCRMARHKNADNPYDPNFGGRWLATKLAYKNPTVDLTQEKNWYLPFE